MWALLISSLLASMKFTLNILAEFIMGMLQTMVSHCVGTENQTEEQSMLSTAEQ